MLIRIQGTEHTDVIINPRTITFAQETKNGCRIHFENGKFIETDALFEEVAEAMETAEAANEK